MIAATEKRGKKAPPKSKPGKWDKPEPQAHASKRGPGRTSRSFPFALRVTRDAAAPEDRKPIVANVGREPRRKYREGEPMRIVRPVRAALRALKEKEA